MHFHTNQHYAGAAAPVPPCGPYGPHASCSSSSSSTFDYYGAIFDHLPADDPDPDVLHFEVIELEVDEGPFAGGEAYVNKWLQLAVDPVDYVRKKCWSYQGVAPSERARRIGAGSTPAWQRGIGGC